MSSSSGRWQPPGVHRGDQLAWALKEVLELLERHALEAAAVRVAEPGGQFVSLGRAEVEGVVQEALASAIQESSEAPRPDTGFGQSLTLRVPQTPQHERLLASFFPGKPCSVIAG